MMAKPKEISNFTPSDKFRAMATFSKQLTVSRPILEVFEYMSDLANSAQWDVNFARVEKLTAGKAALGTDFRVWSNRVVGVSELDYKISEFSSPGFLQYRAVAENYLLTDTITLESKGEGMVKVTYERKIAVKGSLVRVSGAIYPFFKHRFDRALAGLVRALNDDVETEPAEVMIADRLVIPGMIKFTNLGYQHAKKQWKGIAATLEGKNAVVTGATSGLGRETAIALAKMGANVLIVARNERKAEALIDFIRHETGREVGCTIADLELVSDTLKAAQHIQQAFDRIDILVNNAGALFNERQLTKEGFERSFALLLLSPFVLTESLMPQLLAVSQSRVINVSSGGMYTQPVKLDDLQFANGLYDGAKAYARVKRGLVDITEVWSRKHFPASITFNSMHPGWADTPAVASALPGFYRFMKPFLRTPAEGADTIVWLAVAKEVKATSGLFWLDRQPHTTKIFPATSTSELDQQVLYQKLQVILMRFK